MAGQLTAGNVITTTLSSPSGVFATQNGMNGIAKAWCNFNGTSGSTSIRASFNCSSITYVGAGDYYVNFTTAMTDTSYVVTVGVSMNNAGQYGVGNITTASTSYLSIQTSNFGPSLVDVSTICVAVFR